MTILVWTGLGLTNSFSKKNKVSWNIGETTCKFTMTIPKDWSSELMVVEKGHFQTMFFKGPNDVPDSLKYYINIRTGYFPTYRYEEIRSKNLQEDRINIHFLGQELEFMVHFDPSVPLYLIEQIVSLDNVKQGLKVDISISGKYQKDTEALIKILETLKLDGANTTPTPTVVTIDPSTKGIFNRHRQIVKYGTVNQRHEIMTGSQYYYTTDGSLSKIEIYKDGTFLRDSVFVK
jgi:hypothetical protein